MSLLEAPLPRLALMIPGGLALLGGLNGALLLLDLPAPIASIQFRDGHGMILVIAFVGTLIALERAVALRRLWGYASPACLGLGGLLVMADAPAGIGRGLLVAGTGLLVAVYVPLWRRHQDPTVLVQLLGAVLACAATILWLRDVAPAVFLPWLAGFVILTIAAERIELARVGIFDAEVRSGADSRVLVLAHVLVAAAVASVLWPDFGTPVWGLALAVLVWWLAHVDVARRLITSDGARRYMASCLLLGYAWLAVAAFTWVRSGPVDSGRSYDAVIHAVFLGFTITMIMAHAPVILPAVLRRPLPYRSYMYGPMLLLQFGLVVRIGLGDAFDIESMHRLGGVLNIIALLAFVVGALWSTLTANRPVVRPTNVEDLA